MIESTFRAQLQADEEARSALVEWMKSEAPRKRDVGGVAFRMLDRCEWMWRGLKAAFGPPFRGSVLEVAEPQFWVELEITT